MKKISFAFACLGILLGLAATRPSHAQNNFHSYVSMHGTGVACTADAPCGDLGLAVQATVSQGVVSCVDGDPNSIVGFTIGKTLTIDCPGALAASWFLTINGAGIVVTLRNLTISSFGIGGNGGNPGIGIDFQNGAALFVEHCVIENFQSAPGIGINFAPTSGSAKLHVTDSVIKNSGIPGGGGGIFVVPGAGASARVVIERTQLENNSNGIFANASSGLALIDVKDSTIANSSIDGVFAFTTGSIASIVLDHSVSLHNGGKGIQAKGTGAYVTLIASTVAWNAIGLTAITGGLILSYQNNLIAGNPSPGTSPVSLSLQ